jgi:uncharacterized protein YbjT (DUF2867 family)
VEVVKGDVLDVNSLHEALAGVDIAYYLVHSMGSSGSFERNEEISARNFAEAASKAGIERIIYLGGLAEDCDDLSAHMRSRHVTGKVLRSSDVPTIELRASIVIGPGSLSFEMIRALVHKLPVMTTPRWVKVDAQPIAVSDLLEYLVQSMEIDLDESRVFEIGGSDVVAYEGIMLEYARQVGLKRTLIPLPFLTPGLSSLWLGLVTPLYARIGRKLIDSVRHPSVIRDPSAQQVFSIRPKGISEAISEALKDEDRSFEARKWSDSLASSDTFRNWGGARFGSRLVDCRRQEVSVPAHLAFDPVRRIGGARGWYYGNFLWKLRGAMDILAGGVGMRRGRRHPSDLRPGDVVDCWRVERVESDQRLELLAEMKLPGRAWLVFEVESLGARSEICQTAVYQPIGLSGLAYWYLLYPVHVMMWGGMLREICRVAEQGGTGRSSDQAVASVQGHFADHAK